MRVLIVDDSSAVRGLLLDYLSGWGHEVVSATDGEEDWGRLQAADIDLTICDWTMPGMSGTAADGRDVADVGDIRVVAPMALRQRRSQFMVEYFNRQQDEDEAIRSQIDELAIN